MKHSHNPAPKWASLKFIALLIILFGSIVAKSQTLQSVTTAGPATTNTIYVNKIEANLTDNIMVVGRKNNVTSSNQSYIFGYNNTVNNNNGTVFGYQNNVSAQSASVYGKTNTVRGYAPGAFGNYNTFSTSSNLSNAYGNANTVNGTHCGVFGEHNTVSGQNNIAVGRFSTASGNHSFAVGYRNNATNTLTAAFGTQNTASGQSSSAFGKNNTASGTMSSAFGKENVASGTASSAFGFGNNVSGTYAAAFGVSLTNSTNSSVKVGPSNSAYMMILSSGNTGIGTSTPSSKLNVDPAGAGGILIGNSNTSSSNYTSLSMGISSATGGYAVLQAIKNAGSAYGNIYLNPDGGNVGIGMTDATGSFKLAVEGKIGAREVQITATSPWPDYVFEEGYQLMPIEKLEPYIKEFKHLPGVPSQQEVKANNGIELGKMNAKLLEKVEELTLYLIEMKKENIQIKKENAEMKARLLKLESAAAH